MAVLTSISDKHIIYNLKFLSHLCFEVTEACNLNCTYCAFSDLYTKGSIRDGEKMSFETAKTLLDYLWNLWEQDDVKKIPSRLNISFYGGEPLMNFPLIKEIVEYSERNVHRINRHLTYSMTTNAVLLPKHIDYLANKQFNLLISLDGDEWGDSYRVNHHKQPSFSIVIENVIQVKKNYPDYFNEHISFNAVLNNRNSYEAILRFFKETFDKRPTISPLSIANLNPKEFERFLTILNQDQTDYSCLPLDQSPVLRSFIKEFEMKSGNAFYDFNELLYDQNDGATLPTGTCVPFMKKMFLSARGKILQCERINHIFSLGDVTQDGVSLDYKKVANLYNQHTSKYSNQCSTCALSHYCTKCVYLEVDNPCHSYKASISSDIDTMRVQHNLPRAMELVYSSKTSR